MGHSDKEAMIERRLAYLSAAHKFVAQNTNFDRSAFIKAKGGQIKVGHLSLKFFESGEVSIFWKHEGVTQWREGDFFSFDDTEQPAAFDQTLILTELLMRNTMIAEAKAINH
jgi:hypothetical protein